MQLVLQRLNHFFTVFTILCLVTSSYVGAQQSLIFTPTNSVLSRNTQDGLVFASSNPVTSNPGNQGLVFASANQPKPYDASIFSTTANFYPNSKDYDSPPIFASSRSVDVRQPTPASSSSSSSASASLPANSASTSSPSSLTTGRSSSSSSSSSICDTNAKQPPRGPPVFASNRVGMPASINLDVGEYAEQSLRNLSKGAEEFSLEFLAKISNEHLAVPRRSYMVSPLSVWSLLVLLTEGAEDITLKELRNTLRLNNNPPQSLRSAYRQINQRLK